jgi:hypothetical protein
VNNQQIGITQNFNVHSFRNQSLANGIYLLTRAIHDGQQPSDPGDSLTPPAVKVVLGGMLVLLALIGLAMGRRSHDIDQATAFGLACYATLVLSPLAWAHYFVVELPALVCVPFWLFRRGRSTLAWVVPAVPPLLSWCYYLTMKTTGPLGLLGLGTAAWFVLVCGLVLVLDAMPARRTTLYRPNIRTRLANRQPADCSVTSEGL